MVTGLERNEATRTLTTQSGVPCVHLMEASGSPSIHSVGFSQMDASADWTSGTSCWSGPAFEGVSAVTCTRQS